MQVINFLLWALVSFSCVVVVFRLANAIFSYEVPLDVQIYFVVASVVIALSLRPLKKLVDTLTAKIFSQHTYSLHDALSKISSFSIHSVDPLSIQRHSQNVIQETLQPSFIAFVVYEPNGTLKITTHSKQFPSKDTLPDDFLQHLSAVRQKFTNVKNTKWETMVEGLELIVRLSTTNKSIGYLVLGGKKNGGKYDKQDQQFLLLASNDIALALQNALAFEQIQEFNETLQAKVTRATSALKRTNEKLVALDDTKDEFISMASHQLRTPLTSVKGYISMLLEGDLGKINDTQRKALEEAFSSSQRMVFLISDFLNVSRIRTGKFMIERTDTDLNKIVVEEIAQLRDLAGLREQTIRFTPIKDFPIVQMDETKIRQVMMNFIDNAIFYTPKNGTIDIELKKTSKEIVFQVTDTGIGVPKNVQHRLFTKFFRAENARNARPDGTGLGLFMAQKIIDGHGGKVIFHSIENKGSTFGFRLPISAVK